MTDPKNQTTEEEPQPAGTDADVANGSAPSADPEMGSPFRSQTPDARVADVPDASGAEPDDSATRTTTGESMASGGSLSPCAAESNPDVSCAEKVETRERPVPGETDQDRDDDRLEPESEPGALLEEPQTDDDPLGGTGAGTGAGTGQEETDPALSEEDTDGPATDGVQGVGSLEDHVADLQRTVQEGFAEVHRAFDSKIKYDRAKEEIINHLHGEVQEYKANLALKILQPIANDLISLYDDMGKAVDAFRNEVGDSVVAKKLLRLLLQFQTEDIEDILDRYGFEAFRNKTDAFDPRCQRVMKRVPTEDPSKHRKIAERIRKGFKYDGIVLRPEFVAVYVLEKKAPNTESPTEPQVE